jgi:methionine-rich copper-binding protein CopC
MHVLIFSARTSTSMPFARAIAIRTIPALLILLISALALPSVGSGHAELESASPPVGGTVTALPPKMTLVFGEEVRPGSAVVEVTGPDGKRVDTGDTAVDLTDPERRTVIVSLFAGGAGVYTVHWENVSNTDGDPVSGDYAFTVSVAAPGSSPVAAATPENPTPALTATDDDVAANGNPLDPEGDFDSGAFLISVGAGLVALAAIVGFWFVVRPRNPRFGSKADRDQG